MKNLLTENEGKSSIYITQKRLSYTIDNEIETPQEFSDLPKGVKTAIHKVEASNQEKFYPILIRVTDGNKDKSKKIKLSTVVEPKALDAFWVEYTNVLKNGFVGLKKKSKKKAKKSKSKISKP